MANSNLEKSFMDAYNSYVASKQPMAQAVVNAGAKMAEKVGQQAQATVQNVTSSNNYVPPVTSTTKKTAKKTTKRSTVKGKGAGPSGSKKQAAGFNKDVAKPYMKKLGAVLDDLRKDIKKLGDDIQLIEKGDGKAAYWSGRKAKTRVIGLKEHYNNHVKVYNEYLHVYNVLHAKYVTGATNTL